jgi:hypothetical protein
MRRPKRIGLPVFFLLVGVLLLLIAYDADRNGQLFAMRHGVLPWLRPAEGYVMGSMLIVGALYAIVRKRFDG